MSRSCRPMGLKQALERSDALSCSVREIRSSETIRIRFGLRVPKVLPLGTRDWMCSESKIAWARLKSQNARVVAVSLLEQIESHLSTSASVKFFRKSRDILMTKVLVDVWAFCSNAWAICAKVSSGLGSSCAKYAARSNTGSVPEVVTESANTSRNREQKGTFPWDDDGVSQPSSESAECDTSSAK
jgi:hypothetical protein